MWVGLLGGGGTLVHSLAGLDGQGQFGPIHVLTLCVWLLLLLSGSIRVFVLGGNNFVFFSKVPSLLLLLSALLWVLLVGSGEAAQLASGFCCKRVSEKGRGKRGWLLEVVAL